MRIAAKIKFKNAALWELCEQFGSQSALARYLEVPPQSLGAWLNFKRMPNIEDARLAHVEEKLLLLGVSWGDAFPPESHQVYGKIPASIVRVADVDPEHLLRAANPTLLTDGIAEVEGRIRNNELSRALTDVMDMGFSDTEREILTARFGLNGVELESLESIGRRLGKSSERIRQIEIRAVRKMRHPTRAKKLRPFLGS